MSGDREGRNETDKSMRPTCIYIGCSHMNRIYYSMQGQQTNRHFIYYDVKTVRLAELGKQLEVIKQKCIIQQIWFMASHLLYAGKSMNGPKYQEFKLEVTNPTTTATILEETIWFLRKYSRKVIFLDSPPRGFRIDPADTSRELEYFSPAFRHSYELYMIIIEKAGAVTIRWDKILAILWQNPIIERIYSDMYSRIFNEYIHRRSFEVMYSDNTHLFSQAYERIARICQIEDGMDYQDIDY